MITMPEAFVGKVPEFVIPPGCVVSVPVIGTPACATGLFRASTSWTVTKPGFTPTVRVLGTPDTMNFAPVPATAVAVNVTELTVPPAAAVSVYTCAGGPSVHAVSDAMPAALVVTVSAPPLVWLPTVMVSPALVVGLNVTTPPATGLPEASVNFTDGATATALPAVAVWLFPATIVRVAAAPALSAMVPDTSAG